MFSGRHRTRRYYFIDTNCNPALGPKELDVAIAQILDLYGVSFYELLKRLVLNTVRDRIKLDQYRAASPPEPHSILPFMTGVDPGAS